MAHDGVISAERASDFALPVGSWRGYARGQFGGSDLGAFARLGDIESDMTIITLGAGHRAGPDLSWGAALSIARHENELSGATLDSDVALGSLHGAWRSGGLEVSVSLTLGQTSVDVERPVTLGGVHAHRARLHRSRPVRGRIRFGVGIGRFRDYSGTGRFSASRCSTRRSRVFGKTEIPRPR